MGAAPTAAHAAPCSTVRRDISPEQTCASFMAKLPTKLRAIAEEVFHEWPERLLIHVIARMQFFRA
jgi:hypothetical protein